MQIPPLCRGFHPAYQDLPVAYFPSYALLEVLRLGSPRAEYSHVLTAQQVIANPWQVRESEDCYSFIARPCHVTAYDGVEIPSSAHEVFVAHVQPGSLILEDCGWVDPTLQYPGQEPDEAERLLLSSLGRLIMHAA